MKRYNFVRSIYDVRSTHKGLPEFISSRWKSYYKSPVLKSRFIGTQRWEYTLENQVEDCILNLSVSMFY